MIYSKVFFVEKKHLQAVDHQIYQQTIQFTSSGLVNW